VIQDNLLFMQEQVRVDLAVVVAVVMVREQADKEEVV
jgi:hypothetical protein